VTSTIEAPTADQLSVAAPTVIAPTQAPTLAPTGVPTGSPTAPTAAPTAVPTVNGEVMIKSTITIGGVSASQFSESVQSTFKSTIATKAAIDATRVEITWFSRRADLSVSFTVFTGSDDSSAGVNLASTLKSFLEDSTSTGFATKFNAAAAGVTTTGITVTSEPEIQISVKAVPQESAGMSGAIVALIVMLLLCFIFCMCGLMYYGFKSDDEPAADSTNDERELKSDLDTVGITTNGVSWHDVQQLGQKTPIAKVESPSAKVESPSAKVESPSTLFCGSARICGEDPGSFGEEPGPFGEDPGIPDGDPGVNVSVIVRDDTIGDAVVSFIVRDDPLPRCMC